MKPHIFIISLLICGSAVACTTTGTGKKLPVPVVDIDSAEQKAEDSILSHIQDTFTIAMAGDIMMGTTYPKPALPADEGRALFRDVRHILHRADIAVGNLEGTLCDSAENKKEKSVYNYSFRTPLIFSATLVIIVITGILMCLVNLSERLLLGPADADADPDADQ